MGNLSYYMLVILGVVSQNLMICFAANVTANFVFGDSLVDVGNNNYIPSLSKANFFPNGIDFGGPTGRYTNGRTIVDIIGAEVGFKFTPPYLAPTTSGPVILQGVNYASGGGGILNSTGQIFGGRINLDNQLDNFAYTKQNIITRIGETAAMKMIHNALFSVTMGSNDFINNYLIPGLSMPEQLMAPPIEFVGVVIFKYKLQLTRLYNMGARKIVVVNVGPIGCIPYQREINPAAGDQCVYLPNELAILFNTQLRGLVIKLNSKLPGSKFVYADVYEIVQDIIDNYSSYGFESANSACCSGGGRFGGLVPCGPTSRICADRSKYVFWDPYHPSDAANVVIAKRLLDGNSSVIWPMNVRQLLAYS